MILKDHAVPWHVVSNKKMQNGLHTLDDKTNLLNIEPNQCVGREEKIDRARMEDTRNFAISGDSEVMHKLIWAV